MLPQNLNHHVQVLDGHSVQAEDLVGISSCAEILNEYIKSSASANAGFSSRKKRGSGKTWMCNHLRCNFFLINFLRCGWNYPKILYHIYKPFLLLLWGLKFSNNKLILYGWTSGKRKNTRWVGKGESECSSLIWRFSFDLLWTSAIKF